MPGQGLLENSHEQPRRVMNGRIVCVAQITLGHLAGDIKDIFSKWTIKADIPPASFSRRFGTVAYGQVGCGGRKADFAGRPGSFAGEYFRPQGIVVERERRDLRPVVMLQV